MMEVGVEKTTFQKYPEYRYSEAEWIGEIPEHWTISRLKNHVEMITGFPFKSDKYVDSGIKLARGINVKEGVFDWSETRYWPSIDKGLEDYLLKSGDILIGMDGSKVGKNFCIVAPEDLPILLLQRVARLRSLNSIYPAFLFYLIANRSFLTWVEKRKTDPMVPHIAPKDIHDYLIPIPKLIEQTAIASFLDRKTAQIDKAISIKEKQIELLKERRQILIHRAVTRGLDPNVKMKDSGEEWITEMPTHWELVPNRYLFQLKKKLVGRKSNAYDLLSLTLNGVIKRDLDNPQGKFPAEYDSYQEVKKGDFIFCLFDVEETPRTVGLSLYDGMITGAYTVLDLKINIDKEFVYYFYLNLDMDKRLRPLYKGLRNTIPKESFFSFKTFIPPLDEQKSISEFIQRMSTKTTLAIKYKETEIEKLKEYKATLINSAVTGKIKVTQDA